jgi:epoxyqueuosine reductase
MNSHNVVEELERGGVRARFARVEHLRSVQDDIVTLLKEGSLDRALYEEYLSGHDYGIPETFPEARSVVIAAVPSLPIKVVFHRGGRAFETLVPPTYADAKEVDEKVLCIMKRVNQGARFQRVHLALKTLAARTGLILYGRNNIGYVPEQGSFHRLTAFLTDIEVEGDSWGERGVLPACSSCRKCLDACPNEVIVEDRFLVQAELCLSYLNERPSDRPFPEWVQKNAHNALVGCMICQSVCPYDRKVLGDLGRGEVFSEGETALLLGGRYDETMAIEIDRKLSKIGLDRTVFPRNLEALMGSR